MVADHHPAIGLDRALERGDHVPDRPDLVVHDDPEVDLDRPRPDVVGQRQPPLPARGDVRPPQGFQDRPGRVVADRQRGDAGEVVVADQPRLLLPLLDLHGEQGPGNANASGPSVNPCKGSIGIRFAPLTDGPPGRRRVARPEREELHAAALDRRPGAVGAVGIDVPLGVAVVRRVGIDQDALRLPLLGVADLQPAEELAVPRPGRSSLRPRPPSSPAPRSPRAGRSSHRRPAPSRRPRPRSRGRPGRRPGWPSPCRRRWGPR